MAVQQQPKQKELELQSMVKVHRPTLYEREGQGRLWTGGLCVCVWVGGGNHSKEGQGLLGLLTL